MAFDAWLLFVVVAIAPVMSPGPGILLAVSNAMRFGPMATVASGAGNAVGLFFVGLAICFGLTEAMRHAPWAFRALQIIGAIYLIWIGVKMWRDEKALSVSPDADAAQTQFGFFVEAFNLAITNPKAIVLQGALFPQFLDPNATLMQQSLTISGTYAAMCYANHIALAFAGGAVRRMLLSPARLAITRKVLGAVMMAFGLALGFWQV
jgi:homoserine/homoserine lactone efflux protein